MSKNVKKWMSRREFIKLLKRRGACYDALAWLKIQHGEAKDTVIDAQGDWIVWLFHNTLDSFSDRVVNSKDFWDIVYRDSKNYYTADLMQREFIRASILDNWENVEVELRKKYTDM